MGRTYLGMPELAPEVMPPSEIGSYETLVFLSLLKSSIVKFILIFILNFKSYSFGTGLWTGGGTKTYGLVLAGVLYSSSEPEALELLRSL